MILELSRCSECRDIYLKKGVDSGICLWCKGISKIKKSQIYSSNGRLKKQPKLTTRYQEQQIMKFLNNFYITRNCLQCDKYLRISQANTRLESLEKKGLIKIDRNMNPHKIIVLKRTGGIKYGK